MKENKKNIKPIKSLEELKNIKRGQTIQINENLPQDKKIEALNKGFQPNKDYFAFEREVKYNLGPLTPVEIDYSIDPTKETPYYTGNLIIENFKGERLKLHYQHFYRVFSE
ncbi:MAG: hypothetical protein ABEI74_02190 [Candidatus Pacearchaeota archaeon]